MRHELISLYNMKEARKVANYKAKVMSMNSCLVQQEYDLLVLGKEPKKVFKEELTYEKKPSAKKKEKWQSQET